MEDSMDPQEQRAIRRAVEGAGAIPRPAAWTDADYRHFKVTLEENGYTLEPTPAEKKRLAAAVAV